MACSPRDGLSGHPVGRAGRRAPDPSPQAGAGGRACGQRAGRTVPRPVAWPAHDGRQPGLDPSLPLVVLGAALAGFVQGLSGFAFGLVAMAVWAWVLEPQLAGPLVVFGSLLGQLLTLHTIRRDVERGRLLPFLLGGVLGVPLGVWLLQRLDPAGFRLAVGLLLVVWCPAMLLARRLPRLAWGGRLADGGAGLAGGVMGGLGGLSGPAPILWVTLRGWGRDAQRAVFQPFNLAMHLLTMAAYLLTGTVAAETARLFLVIAPAVVLPALAGARLYRGLDDEAFRRLVLALLAASGAMLVATSLG